MFRNVDITTEGLLCTAGRLISNKTYPDDNEIITVDNESGKVIKAKDKEKNIKFA